MFLVLKSSSETLQAEEKRRWPTFSTLNVRLHQVGGAASAGWLIRGIIAKGTQTVHPLFGQDCCFNLPPGRASRSQNWATGPPKLDEPLSAAPASAPRIRQPRARAARPCVRAPERRTRERAPPPPLPAAVPSLGGPCPAAPPLCL